MAIKIDYDRKSEKYTAKLGSLTIKHEDVSIIRKKIKDVGQQYTMSGKALKAWKNDRGV